MAYNKDQWISSFEDAMVKLRPHITMRVLTTIGLMAWNQKGRQGVDRRSRLSNGRDRWTRRREAGLQPCDSVFRRLPLQLHYRGRGCQQRR